MGTDGIDDHDAIADVLERLGAIALRLADADTPQVTLQRIVDLGEELVTGAEGVNLVLIDKRGRIEIPAYTSDEARGIDVAQFETGEGPCLDAFDNQRTVVVDDLETEQRWPDYRARALEAGMRSMMGFRLYVIDDSMGALNMYSTRPNAFDGRAQMVGQVFAAHASVAMKAAMTEAGLRIAIESRDVIEQAKGILIARYRITDDMAFDLLRRMSQDRNRPVRDIAADIVRAGKFPEASQVGQD